MISFAALKTVILYHIATYTYQYKKKKQHKVELRISNADIYVHENGQVRRHIFS